MFKKDKLVFQKWYDENGKMLEECEVGAMGHALVVKNSREKENSYGPAKLHALYAADAGRIAKLFICVLSMVARDSSSVISGFSLARHPSRDG
jgi:hypothetical protein